MTTARKQAFQDLLAAMGSMGATELVDHPYVILAIDVPVDQYDDPTDPGITFVIGPFPTASEALAAAEVHEAELNGIGPTMWRVIAVPIVPPSQGSTT